MGKGGTSRVESYSSALQAQAAQQQAALAAKQYAWWEKLYAPEEKKMMQTLSKPVEEQAYFKRMMGDVEKQYGDITANTARTMGGRYQYGSGFEGAAQKNIGLSRASTRGQLWGAGEEMRRSNLMGMFGMGRGSAEAGMQGWGAAGAQAGDVAARLGGLRAQKMGQMTSATTGICCFIFYEGHGELREDIKKARDEMFTEDSRVSHGYRIMANKLVPLMRKHKWIKRLVQKIMLDPIAEAIRRSNIRARRFPYHLIAWSWVGIWYVTSFIPGTAMTWEKYHQEVGC
jgi:hypothetical protein